MLLHNLKFKPTGPVTVWMWMEVEVPVSRSSGIPFFYDWVRYAILGGFSFGGWTPPPLRYVSWPLLESGCPVGLSDGEHAYADIGDDIIHAYVRLLHTRLQQSDRDSYSVQIKC